MQVSAETLQYIKEHQHDDVRLLALQAKKYPEVDMTFAVTQIAGRQIAAVKLPTWATQSDLFYPRHLSMEQCSSEATALYKSGLVQGESFADLTGGFGVDCSFLSRRFRTSHYVERQSELCDLARHNFPLLGLDIEVHHQDSVSFLQQMQPVDCIYLDPARRDGHGGKTVAISDCEPNLCQLEELLVTKARTVLVKLSPMLDLSLALKELHYVREVHIVSVQSECKELLLLLSKDALVSEVPVHCTQLLAGGEQRQYVFTQEQERSADCPLAASVGDYLYEPNASILKAGAYRSLTQAYPVKKLHVSSHLYTSDSLVTDFPGRTFKVIAVAGFGKKDLKALLGGLEKANLTIRNFPSSVVDLRKRLKLKEGGDDYLFATTLANGEKVLVHCRK